MFVFTNLGRYFFRRFAVSIVIVTLTFFVLIYLGDLIELMRRAGDAKGASVGILAKLSLYRVPAVTEQIFPFAVLFGSLAAFLNLNRRLELVIARASGVSVWQFTSPALLIALLLGVFIIIGFNPLAVSLKNKADELESRIFSRNTAQNTGVWLDQKSAEGSSILRANSVVGSKLFVVTAFVSDKNGQFKERIEAPSAELKQNTELKQGFWQFESARVLSTESEPKQFETYALATNLNIDELSSSIGASESVSFWNLPRVISRLELAGLDATRYRLKYQTLLARPALLIAMILVAGSVSLRFFRFGGIARMVLSGILAGFLLYVATKLAENLGNAGVISTIAAAWLPATFGGLVSILTLFVQEDG
jgi:lipopolysaccharide export system permease protein